MAKKTETENKKRAKRNDSEIFTMKVNQIGKILDTQIVKLKKTKRNAIKSGNVDKYNAMLKHFGKKLNDLEITETETESNESDTFDIDSLTISDGE